MRESTAGIVRGEWTFNEREYYIEALHYYSEVLFIDPRRVTYTLDRRKNQIVVQQEGVVLNDLAMLYTFGRIDKTLLLVKYLEMCGCPTSDPFNTISRDCMGKVTESLHIFSEGAGTTSHLLTSLPLAREYFTKLDPTFFPLLNKPIRGNQGKGIVALHSSQEAIAFCESHFKKRADPLVFEQLMKYQYEYRVYVVDGKTVETYEKVRNDDAVVMNLHQGAYPQLVGEDVKARIFAFINEHLPERYRQGVYGVDLAVTDEGQYHIIEINRTPGFTGLRKLQLINFPRYVHKVLSKRARRTRFPQTNRNPTITLLGDTNPGETYQLRLEQLGKENILKIKGYDYSFEKFHDFLKESDFTLVNLEACITGQRKSSLETIKPYLDWTDLVETPNLLKRLGVDAVSLANNHTLDFGSMGLEEMLNLLRNHDIASFGAGTSAQEAANALHHHISFGERNLHIIVASGFEYRENHADWGYYATPDSAGVNSWRKSEVAKQLKNLRQLYPDAFLIAFPHWGSNYQYVSERQEALAHNIIEAGADLIIGHGSHMMQEIEVYKGRWIIYGIGNFVYNSPGRFSRFDVLPFGLLTRLTVSICDDRICINVQLYPTCTDNDKTGYQSDFVTEHQFRQVVDFFMPFKKGAQTDLVRRMRAGKDCHGFYLTFDVFL